jgi:hypothetical protein
MRMKKVLGCLTLVCGLNLFAQSPSDYRIIDGHLYNVPKSIMWTEIPPLDEYHSGTIEQYSAKVYSVKSDCILVETTVSSNFNVENHEWQNRIVLIENHPKQKVFTTGDKFPRDRLFPIGNRTLTNAIGGTLTVRCYDYGLPNTEANRKMLKPK